MLTSLYSNGYIPHSAINLQEYIYTPDTTCGRYYGLSSAEYGRRLTKLAANVVDPYNLAYAYENTEFKVYLFQFIKDNTLMFSKIGSLSWITTPMIRLQQEINIYQPDCVIIDSVISTGEIPAEGAEGYIRGMLLKMSPYRDSWIPHDRFEKYISKSLFEKIALDFLE